MKQLLKIKQFAFDKKWVVLASLAPLYFLICAIWSFQENEPLLVVASHFSLAIVFSMLGLYEWFMERSNRAFIDEVKKYLDFQWEIIQYYQITVEQLQKDLAIAKEGALEASDIQSAVSVSKKPIVEVKDDKIYAGKLKF